MEAEEGNAACILNKRVPLFARTKFYGKKKNFQMQKKISEVSSTLCRNIGENAKEDYLIRLSVSELGSIKASLVSSNLPSKQGHQNEPKGQQSTVVCRKQRLSSPITNKLLTGK